MDGGKMINFIYVTNLHIIENIDISVGCAYR